MFLVPLSTLYKVDSELAVISIHLSTLVFTRKVCLFSARCHHANSHDTPKLPEHFSEQENMTYDYGENDVLHLYEMRISEVLTAMVD